MLCYGRHGSLSAILSYPMLARLRARTKNSTSGDGTFMCLCIASPGIQRWHKVFGFPLKNGGGGRGKKSNIIAYQVSAGRLFAGRLIKY